MGCGTSFVKYVLFFFNLAVALLGLAIVGIGVAVLMKWDYMKEVLTEHNLTVAPWVFIAIGAVMFLIAFFGCCGAIRESHCMVVTYAIFVLVVIIVQVALGVLMFTYSASIKEAIINGVSRVYDRRHDEASAKVFDNIQEQFQCCGKSGPQDYGLSVLSLPPSCCTREGTILGTCTPVNANRVGCATYIGEFYEKWNSTIAGIAIGVACVEVVGALFALCLANSIRNMDRRYA